MWPMFVHCLIIALQYGHQSMRTQKLGLKKSKGKQWYLAHKSGINFKYSDYKELLNYFGLPSIENRHTFTDICFGFKVLNNLVDSPHILQDFSLHAPPYHARSNNLFYIPLHRTNYGMNTSRSRISRSINKYDIDPFATTSLQRFKNLVRNTLSAG